MAPKGKNHFYCVARGRTNGIFTDWSKCEISVHKFHNAVHKGFQTLEQAIHFMMATGEFSSCHDIPVHDLDRTIHVTDLGHQCSTGCSSLTSNLDSQDEDTEIQINLVKEIRQDTLENQCEVHEEVNSENTSVKTVVCADLPADRSMSICSYCQESSAESYDVIQCSDCKVWCHYQCTRLPLYQLYIYDLTSRKYTCEPCCEVPDDVKADYQSLIHESAVIVNTDVSTREVEINTECTEKSERGMNTVNPVMKEAATSSEDLIEEGKIHDGECQCEKMEGDFVKLIDRMTETYDQSKKKNETGGTINTTKSSQENNSTQIKEQTQRIEMMERKLKEASNKTDKAEKACQDLQIKLNSTFIQNEIQQSKLKGEIDILNNRLKTERVISEALQSDIENLETRYKNRNLIIDDYDNKMKSQVLEINNLREEILSLKLHACRADDFLLKQNSESRLQDNTVIEITPEKQPGPIAKKRLEGHSLIAPLDTRHSTPNVKDKPTPVMKDNVQNKIQDKSKARVTGNRSDNADDPKRSEIGNRPSFNRKQILLIGTSNTRYLSARSMAGRNSYIKKVTKYTVNEAKEFIENYDLEFTPEIIVYQLGCNDIDIDFSDQMGELVSTTNLKFPGIKVMVSLGLPRGQRNANLKVIEQSNVLVKKYQNHESVILCDNSKLFYKGKPLKGVLRDEKHLSRKGTSILAQNLKRAIENISK